MSRLPENNRVRKARANVTSLPHEVLALIVSLLKPRDHAAAVLASRRFGVLTPEERGRLHFARREPKALARAGSLEGVRYWHGIDPWRIDIHCLRAAAEGGHREMVQWILDESTGGGCPTEALCAAARGGHVPLMRWLLEERKATILREVLSDAISSANVDAVRLILDRAHEIDRREAIDSGTIDDDDGKEDDNGDDDDDDDDGDDGKDDVWEQDDQRTSHAGNACRRDWGSRAMRVAVRTNNIDVIQLVYEQCYDCDPEILCRSLCEAPSCDATATTVDWILERCTDEYAVRKAFKAALKAVNRDVAIAILSRWPGVAQPVTAYPWPVERMDESTVPILDTAFAVASRTLPDPWPVAPDEATTDPARIYDAVLAQSLSREFMSTSRTIYSSLFDSCPCYAAFCWVVDIARYVPAVYNAETLARKGMIDRLDYCRERGLFKAEHIVGAMVGAAGAGRIDVLVHVWSRAIDTEHGDVNDTTIAGAVRANVQKIADAAAESGDWAIVEWLQRHVSDRAHCTAAAFSVASKRGHAEFLKRLYAAGADRCRHPCDAACEVVPGWSPFPYALRTPCGLYDVNDLWRRVAREGHYDVVKVLRDHGVLNGLYLRNDAALRGHAAICAIDIAVNGPSKRDSMIQYAVQARDHACLVLALTNGSAWEPFGSWSVHPMVTAVKKGSRAIRDLLARHQSKINTHLPEYGDDAESNSDSETD
ncbi:Ankyrin repeat domain containing protein [Pandoravirus macleodensis]|uniref:Ankyrin repeat domain containing protein n=1 Tax=Pandoravirus macleodensis TaxID=2107707 RepID=A0A2U7UFZ5_9VIRU|nr:Ankyrin repeat domain containing protein [Pandoravirus macleodensis]AVK77352.1 Ankyrin repeat domain containing protein [Pandoravirus macleodensis]